MSGAGYTLLRVTAIDTVAQAWTGEVEMEFIQVLDNRKHATLFLGKDYAPAIAYNGRPGDLLTEKWKGVDFHKHVDSLAKAVSSDKKVEPDSVLGRVAAVAELFPIEVKNALDEKRVEKWAQVLSLDELRERGALPWKMLVQRRKRAGAGKEEDYAAGGKAALVDLECEMVGTLLERALGDLEHEMVGVRLERKPTLNGELHEVRDFWGPYVKLKTVFKLDPSKRFEAMWKLLGVIDEFSGANAAAEAVLDKLKGVRDGFLRKTIKETAQGDCLCALSFKYKLFGTFGQALALDCFPVDHQFLYVDAACSRESVPVLLGAKAALVEEAAALEEKTKQHEKEAAEMRLSASSECDKVADKKAALAKAEGERSKAATKRAEADKTASVKPWTALYDVIAPTAGISEAIDAAKCVRVKNVGYLFLNARTANSEYPSTVATAIKLWERVWANKDKLSGNTSVLNWATSSSSQEWSAPLVQPVDSSASDPKISRSAARYPHAIFSFTTRRSPTHAILNVVVPYFLVTSSLGVAATLSSADTRLQVMSAFFAVGMGLRFVSTSLLPRIDYATLLDQYVLACLIFMVLATLEAAVYSSPLLAEAVLAGAPSSVATFDALFWLAMTTAWLLTNVLFATFFCDARADADDEDDAAHIEMNTDVLDRYLSTTSAIGVALAWVRRKCCCARHSAKGPPRPEPLQPTCALCEAKDVDRFFWSRKLTADKSLETDEIKELQKKAEDARLQKEAPSCSPRGVCCWRHRRIASGRIACAECIVTINEAQGQLKINEAQGQLKETWELAHASAAAVRAPQPASLPTDGSGGAESPGGALGSGGALSSGGNTSPTAGGLLSGGALSSGGGASPTAGGLLSGGALSSGGGTSPTAGGLFVCTACSPFSAVDGTPSVPAAECAACQLPPPRASPYAACLQLPGAH